MLSFLKCCQKFGIITLLHQTNVEFLQIGNFYFFDAQTNFQ